MLKIKKITIDVAKNLATIINSRDIVFSLKRVIAKSWTKAIDLDFNNVEFVSRSAAHELLLLRDSLNSRFFMRKEINFVNANNDVTNMLRIVAASRVAPKPKEESHIQKTDIDHLSQLAF